MFIALYLDIVIKIFQIFSYKGNGLVCNTDIFSSQMNTRLSQGKVETVNKQKK